jgi:hypothetical protein
MGAETEVALMNDARDKGKPRTAKHVAAVVLSIVKDDTEPPASAGRIIPTVA